MGFFLESRVLMADGAAKPIGDVRRGDKVACGDGRVASVRDVVAYRSRTQMANRDGLRLTPTHAVRCPSSSSPGTWRYAREIATQVPYDEVAALVDLDLDEHHEVIAVHVHGTVACMTLGHAGWSDPGVLFGAAELARGTCSACGASNERRWRLECGCAEDHDYCSRCFPRACAECS